MSTIPDPTVNSIPLGNRRPRQFVAAILIAFGFDVRASIRAMGDVIERRFADFAAVPYQSRLSRQQWEELWEAETEHQPQRVATRRAASLRQEAAPNAWVPLRW